MSDFPHVADISAGESLTLAQAAGILRQALVDRRFGETPISEHVVAYLDSLEYADAQLNTLLAYEHVLGLFAVEHADLALSDLEPPRGGGVVRAFLDRHWQTKSAATRRQRLAIMRSFLAWLVGEGLLRANPAQNIRPPKVKRKARDVLSREDLDALVAAQPTLRDQAALTLLVWLGLRKDELRRLRLCDIDLQERTLVVHRKGGHLDKLPMGFEHVYNALALYMRDRGADEYLLHPERRPIAAMEASTVHRWFRGAQARRAFKRVGLARPSTCCRRCTARSHRRHRPRAATPAPLRHPNDPRLSKPQYGASCSRDAPGRGSVAPKRCRLAAQFTITGVMSSWGF